MKRADRYLQINRHNWEQKAAHHFHSRFYDVAGFKRGRCSLHAIEQQEVGSVRGKRLLHLQCHFGMDTLSWARLGARVTGVDFSRKSIEYGRQLAAELKIPATFVCSDIYRLRRHLKGQQGKFDRVYISYGSLGWLPDMRRYMQVVAHFLAPGGELHIIEFHPVFWMFDGHGPVNYPYDSGGQPIVIEPDGTYAAPKAKLKGSEYWYNHGLETIISGVLAAGLRLTRLKQHNHSPYKLEGTVKGKKRGQWVSRDRKNQIPLIFSLVAEQPKTRRR